MKNVVISSSFLLAFYSAIMVNVHEPQVQTQYVSIAIDPKEVMLKAEEFRKSLIKSKKSSIFQVIIEDGSGKTVSLGSGFIISPSGLAVTCYHVVDTNKKVKVVLGTGEVYYAEVVLVNEQTDSALLKLPPRGSSYNYSELSTSAKEGDTAFVYSNPHGIKNALTQGIVAKSDTKGEFALDSFTLFDAGVAPGSSGGAIFNVNGEIIGMVDAVFTQGSLMLGVKASDLKELLTAYTKHPRG